MMDCLEGTWLPINFQPPHCDNIPEVEPVRKHQGDVEELLHLAH